MGSNVSRYLANSCGINCGRTTLPAHEHLEVLYPDPWQVARANDGMRDTQMGEVRVGSPKRNPPVLKNPIVRLRLDETVCVAVGLKLKYLNRRLVHNEKIDCIRHTHRPIGPCCDDKRDRFGLIQNQKRSALVFKIR